MNFSISNYEELAKPEPGSSIVYLSTLSIFMVLLLLLERFWPWRPEQRQARVGLGSDVAFAIFNALVLGPLIVFVCSYVILGFLGGEPRLAGRWPLWLQCLVGVIGMDFVQWLIHNSLHRVSFLWRFHKVHHSIVNGEMDFWASLRLHWVEQLLYIPTQAVGFLLLGFSPWVIIIHGLLVLIFGFFNHANFELGYGPLRYLLNTSKMHIWHHDADSQRPQNLGIIFSTWDWIFGTHFFPETNPRRLGFSGVESFPRGFLRQSLWLFRR